MSVQAQNLTDSTQEVERNLEAADETLQGQPRNKTPYFSQTSAIVLGALPEGNLVAQAFKIGEEVAKFIFNAARMPAPSAMITTSPKRVDSSGAVIASTIESRNTTAIKKAVDDIKDVGKGFQGIRVRIPIPQGAAAKLKVPFTKAGVATTKKRRNVYVLFPKTATKRAIAVWIATHVDPVYKSEINTFYMPSGVKSTFDPTKLDITAPAELTALLGKFSTKYKNRLLEQPVAPNA